MAHIILGFLGRRLQRERNKISVWEPLCREHYQVLTVEKEQEVTELHRQHSYSLHHLRKKGRLESGQ